MAVAVQPGDFCCVPVSGEAGELIRLGEQLNGTGFTQYQHAEIYAGSLIPEAAGTFEMLIRRSGAPYGWTFSAYPGGARLKPLPCPPEELPGALWSSGAFELTGTQRRKIITAALKYEGIPYSWLDYVALAAHRLRIPVPGLRKYIAATGHQICSQITDNCYLDAGIHLFNDGRWPGYVTPADLARLIHDRLEGGTAQQDRTA